MYAKIHKMSLHISQLKSEIYLLHSEKEALHLKKLDLSKPERIRELARQYGLQEHPEQLVFINRK